MNISAYPTLKDEKYYESFKRSVLVTARSHDCEEILQPTFSPRGDADSLELFRLQNDFMYSVFNKCLLSDMGKTIVRNHLDTMNAQWVWEEFATHMTTSSKGKAKKCRLLLIPNRESHNGYPTVRPAELQSVTLSHQVDTHKTLTTHKLACSCFVALFGHQ